jgi:hypothetical protein
VRRYETRDIYGRMTVPYNENCMRQKKVLERERMCIVGKTCDVKGQIDHHIRVE